MGPVPENTDSDDEDLVVDDAMVDGDEDDSSTTTTGVPRGRRAERRRAAQARRGAGARNRAAVFSQNLPGELKKLGVMVAGTVVILGVLTVFLG